MCLHNLPNVGKVNRAQARQVQDHALPTGPEGYTVHLRGNQGFLGRILAALCANRVHLVIAGRQGFAIIAGAIQPVTDVSLSEPG